MEDLIKGELDWHNKVNENFHEVDSQMAEIIQQQNYVKTLIISKSGGNYHTIQEAITYLRGLSTPPSTSNRYCLLVMPGIYEERVDPYGHGIDIIGLNNKTTTIQWYQNTITNEDTMRINYDMILANVTVLHYTPSTDTDNSCYPLHCDYDSGAFTCQLINVIGKAFGANCHHGLGIGLHSGQNLILTNCEFDSDVKPGLYMHNVPSLTSACSLILTNTIVNGCITGAITTNKEGFLIEDTGSGTVDEVYITNSNIKTYQYGENDLLLQKHASFTGDRNNIRIVLNNSNIRNYQSTNGRQIVNLKNDEFAINSDASGLDERDIVEIDPTNADEGKVRIKKCATDASKLIYGVATTYYDAASANGALYVRRRGVASIKADATSNAINVGDYLTSTNYGAARKGTIGSGNCFAVAFQAVPQGSTGDIKALLIEPK